MNKVSFLAILAFFSTSSYAPLDRDKIPSLLEGKTNMVDVAIIGSGPAGCAAAINPARSGFHTVLFQGPKPLGELYDASVVENWPGLEKESGATSMKKLEQQARGFGALFSPLTVSEVDFSVWPRVLKLSDGTTVHASTVICATGASQRKLGVEGESTYYGRGVFSCGLCDGKFTTGKDTLVIGGSDIAVQRALQLLPDAKSITLIIPGPTMTAHESMQKRLEGLCKVRKLFNKEVTKIAGDGTNITHVELYDTQSGQFSTHKTSSIFLSTGLTPNTELFKDKLTLDKFGCITLKAGRTQETEIEGVMAAGNVADPRYRQVAVVMGDGTKASIDALKKLSEWEFDTKYRNLTEKNRYIPTQVPHPAIQQITSLQHYKNTLKRSKLPVLIEFYSPFCSSCKKMEAPVSTMTERYKTALKVFQIDKDKLYDLVKQTKISLIPAFLLFINGKEVNRMEGETTLDALCDFVEKNCKLKPCDKNKPGSHGTKTSANR